MIPERFRKTVRHHFKVDEEVPGSARERNGEWPYRGQMKVERAVHKLEPEHTTVHQSLQAAKSDPGELTYGNV